MMAEKFKIISNVKFLVNGVLLFSLLVLANAYLITSVRVNDEYRILKISIILLIFYIAFYILFLLLSTITMKYELTSNGIRIKIPLITDVIPYSWIKEVEIKKLTLNCFTLIPFIGLIYGTYIIEQCGPASVYGIRTDHEVVVLRLTDDTNVILTPKNPQKFVESILNYKNKFGRNYPVAHVNTRILYLMVCFSLIIALILYTVHNAFSFKEKVLFSAKVFLSYNFLAKSFVVLLPLLFLSFNASKYFYRSKIVAYFIVFLIPFLTLLIVSLVITVC